jgi:ABC-type branched-subunit amino acid transport system ATPase component
MALHFAGRRYVLENGGVVLEGGSEGLLANPQVKKANLGG